MRTVKWTESECELLAAGVAGGGSCELYTRCNACCRIWICFLIRRRPNSLQNLSRADLHWLFCEGDSVRQAGAPVHE
jgi:hypothetical protein